MKNQTPKELPNVTLIAVCGSKHGETIAAIYKTLQQIKPAKTLMLTNIDLSATGVEVINVGGLKSWEAYNHFCIKELDKYFETSHCLLIQWDGYVLDGDCWDDEFLSFDYVGAKWLDKGKPYNVGNGGFSARSKVLQHILATDENIITTCPEDVSICKVYGQYLIDNHKIQFAPEDIADKFSFELNEPLFSTFGFHGFHWRKFRPTVVVMRDHALGDVIMLEPVLEYFHKQGYQVALDTQPEFLMVYFQHYFPVVPKSHLNPKLPYKEVDLNYSYEIKPRQPVLQSYFEMAGIKDIPLRNSRLSLRAGENQTLFNKYCLIHVDQTGMEYRNQFGVNWKSVVLFLEEKGFTVFQIGRRIEKEIATYLNTMSLEFMMFLVKGASLVIALDSGVAQVAVGFDTPLVVMFGSVDPNLRYHNFEKIRVVQSECPIPEKKNCYHEEVARTVGSDCIVDKNLPPCTTYTTDQLLNAIKSII